MSGLEAAGQLHTLDPDAIDKEATNEVEERAIPKRGGGGGKDTSTHFADRPSAAFPGPRGVATRGDP
jgi:hypothetical protein